MPDTNPTRRLSKSRFQVGVKCAKALWLRVHRQDLADEVSDNRLHDQNVGTRVGELARQRFPAGALVGEDYQHQIEALEHTARLVASGVDAVFEGAFEADGVDLPKAE